MKVGDVLHEVTIDVSSDRCSLNEKKLGQIVKFHHGSYDFMVKHLEHSTEEKLYGETSNYSRSLVYDPAEPMDYKPKPHCFITASDDRFRGVILCLERDISIAKTILREQAKEVGEKTVRDLRKAADIILTGCDRLDIYLDV